MLEQRNDRKQLICQISAIKDKSSFIRSKKGSSEISNLADLLHEIDFKINYLLSSKKRKDGNDSLDSCLQATVAVENIFKEWDDQIYPKFYFME